MDASLNYENLPEDLESLKEMLYQKLMAKNQTLSTAESCTGGLLSAEICKYPGVSQIFVGGIVAYDNKIKIDILNVQPKTIRTLGAVSLAVTQQMALGAKKIFGTHWGVAISGIAGPSGGSIDKPVGLVCFTLLGPGVTWSRQENFKGNRVQIMSSSVLFALKSLIKLADG